MRTFRVTISIQSIDGKASSASDIHLGNFQAENIAALVESASKFGAAFAPVPATPLFVFDEAAGVKESSKVKP